MTNKKPTADVMLVSFDRASGDIPVLIVGRKEANVLNVINAYSGKEAEELYEKLSKPKIESLKEKHHDQN